MQWVDIQGRGFVARERIVAIGVTSAAPLRRLVAATDSALIVDLTGGDKRQTMLMLDSGHVVITAISLQEWLSLSRG